MTPPKRTGWWGWRRLKGRGRLRSWIPARGSVKTSSNRSKALTIWAKRSGAPFSFYSSRSGRSRSPIAKAVAQYTIDRKVWREREREGGGRWGEFGRGDVFLEERTTTYPQKNHRQPQWGPRLWRDRELVLVGTWWILSVNFMSPCSF